MNITLRWVERFWAKVDRGAADECWEWTASTTARGYGQFFPPGPKVMVLAHRASYEIAFGDPPAGLLVCHRCDNRTCVNPAHLFPGTAADNSADMVAKGRSAAGERSAKAKLTDAEVAEIRALYTGRYGEQAELARRFAVSPPTIHRILSSS